MLTLKVILILLFLISGGAITHPRISAYLKRHKWFRLTAYVVAFIGGVYLFIGLFMDIDNGIRWTYQRLAIGRYFDRNHSISECDRKLTVDCVRYGGAFGDGAALTSMRACRNLQLLPSSLPPLQWTSLWITNIYSYAPGGGGPGGGLIDEVLKVGGWGDWYFSLIKFALSAKSRVRFAGVLLFVQADEQETVPLFIDRIIEPWK